MTETIILIVLLGIIMIVIFSSIITVKQGDAYVIERLGVYQNTLYAGVHYVVPIVDKVVRKLPVSDAMYTTPALTFTTYDDLQANVQIRIEYTLENPKLFHYSTNKDRHIVDNLITDRSKYSFLKVPLSALKFELQTIEIEIQEQLLEPLSHIGVTLRRVSVDI